MSRLADLIVTTAKPNWDDEGGVAIDAGRWMKAQDLIHSIQCRVPGAGLGYLSAAGDGGIHIRWSDANRMLDAEFTEDEEIYWVSRSTGQRRRDFLDHPGTLEQLVSVLEKLFK